MSFTSPRNLVLALAVIVSLIGATVLVAGYAERTGQAAAVAADACPCDGCPPAGTQECCLGTGQGECGEPRCIAPAQAGCRMKARTGCTPAGCMPVL